MSPALVAGADVCRGGWALATLELDGDAPPTIRLVERFDEVVEEVEAGELDAVAVDIPIGLPERGPRACDLAARKLVGPRRSSVYPAPIRPLLGARTHAEATARRREIEGRGVSVQTFGLFERIIEVDSLITSVHQGRIRESHPEVVFARLKGESLEHPKRRTAGRAERLKILKPLVGDLADLRHPRGMAGDDVLDAVACALAARALVHKQAHVLGDRTTDARGLFMEIVAL